MERYITVADLGNQERNNLTIYVTNLLKKIRNKKGNGIQENGFSIEFTFFL